MADGTLSAVEEDDERFVEGPTGMALFSTANTAYRIFRLSIELFLVEHMLESDHPATFAGTIFLAYSMADIIAGLFFLWWPTIWFGDRSRGLVFFILSVAAMAGGFVGIFLTSSLGVMIASGIVCGIGTATWFVNYQTLMNTTFSELAMSKIAHMRMGFECLGFLLPSICLAIVSGSEQGETILVSVVLLTALGGLFFLASSCMVINACSDVDHDRLVQSKSIASDLKEFAKSSVIKYFAINAILLALSNIFFASLSTITKRYFGLEPYFVWIAAIGVPIGGVASSIFNIKGWFIIGDDKQGVLNGTRNFCFIFVILVLVSPLIEDVTMTSHPDDGSSGAKVALFFFGLVIGFIYSRTHGAAFALWLIKLKEQDTNFISRANVIHNVGVQLIIAVVFQVQTVLIDVSSGSNMHPMLGSLILFGPLILLNIVAHIIVRQVPFCGDPKFDWPIPTPFDFWTRCAIRMCSSLGMGSVEDLAFGVFCDFRTALFAQYLDDAPIPSTPPEEMDSVSSTKDLQGFLRHDFKGDKSQDQWWCSSANFTHLLLSNHAAFRQRIYMINNAESTIDIASWSISDGTGELITDALIKKIEQFVKVRVIVDSVNLYFEDEKETRFGLKTGGLSCLKRLVKAGASVQMLDTWHRCDSKKPYVIGSHRKIMLVDDKVLMTGGRNLEDNYSRSENAEMFKFLDVDVVLEGDFTQSTTLLFEHLWQQSRSIKLLLRRNFPTEFDNEESVHQKELMAELSSDASPPSFRRMSVESEIFSKAWSSSRVGSSISATEIAKTGAREIDDIEAPPEHSSALLPSSSRRRSTGSITSRRLSSFDLSSSMTSVGGIEGAERSFEVSLIQLDHKAGSRDDSDIVLSSLLRMIETAEKSIDLLFGYFQLFPVMRGALTRAVARGVKVRLFTNSRNSNDVYFFNGVFGEAMCHLLEMGAEIWVPQDATELCLHYKCALIDSKVMCVGSWNMWGTSIFYDSEFSVIIIAKEEIKGLTDFIDDLINSNLFTQITERPAEWSFPKFFLWASSKYARNQITRGY